jgi:hypothetical protein
VPALFASWEIGGTEKKMSKKISRKSLSQDDIKGILAAHFGAPVYISTVDAKDFVQGSTGHFHIGQTGDLHVLIEVG